MHFCLQGYPFNKSSQHQNPCKGKALHGQGGIEGTTEEYMIDTFLQGISNIACESISERWK